VAMVARVGAGRISLPKVEVEDGEVMPARAGSVCEICVRAGDAVESAVLRTGRPPWLFATRVQCGRKGGWLYRAPGPAGPGEQPGG
jgi:hypothetical protein